MKKSLFTLTKLNSSLFTLKILSVSMFYFIVYAAKYISQCKVGFERKNVITMER